MINVHIWFLMLESSLGVLLLGNRSDEASQGFEQKFFKLYNAAIKFDEFMTKHNMYQHYGHAILTHWNELDAIKQGRHARQADIESLAGKHPIVFGFTNINMLALRYKGEEMLENKVDEVVERAKGSSPRPVHQDIEDMGEDFKQGAHHYLDPLLERARNEANVRMIRFYRGKDQLLTEEPEEKWAVGHKAVSERMERELGLNRNGQLAFLRVQMAAEKNLADMKELKKGMEAMQNSAMFYNQGQAMQDVISQLNDNGESLLELNDGKDAAELVLAIHEEMSKQRHEARKGRMDRRSFWLKHNWKGGHHLEMACKFPDNDISKCNDMWQSSSLFEIQYEMPCEKPFQCLEESFEIIDAENEAKSNFALAAAINGRIEAYKNNEMMGKMKEERDKIVEWKPTSWVQEQQVACANSMIEVFRKSGL